VASTARRVRWSSSDLTSRYRTYCPWTRMKNSLRSSDDSPAGPALIEPPPRPWRVPRAKTGLARQGPLGPIGPVPSSGRRSSSHRLHNLAVVGTTGFGLPLILPARPGRHGAATAPVHSTLSTSRHVFACPDQTAPLTALPVSSKRQTSSGLVRRSIAT
jgi:hypothetical protein